jgi:hypothetical protein
VPERQVNVNYYIRGVKMENFKAKTKINAKKANASKSIINDNINGNINTTMVNVVLAVLTSFSLVYALTFTLGFDYSPIKILVITFFVVIVYAIILLNKYSLIITGISAAVIVCSQLIYLIYKKALSDSLEAISAILQWNYNYIIGYEELDKIYQNYTTLFLILVISLLIYIFTKKQISFLIILCGIFVFVIQWMMDYSINFFSFYLFIFLVILYYFRHIYMKNSKKSYHDYVNPIIFILYVLPFCLMIFIVSFALPKNSEPIEWEWLDRNINKVYDYFNDKFRYASYDYFSFNSTGFGQDDGKLGGKVKLDKTPVLRVESSKKIYLKGAGRDVYTGYSWSNSNTNPVFFNLNSLNLNSILLNYPSISTGEENSKKSGDNIEIVSDDVLAYDILEPILGINLLLEENPDIIATDDYIDSGKNNNAGSTDANDFLEENKVTITYLNLKTKTLFTLPGLLEFSFSTLAPEEIYIDQEGMISTGKKLGKGFQYTINTYNLKYNEDKVIELLRRSYKGLYNDLLKEHESEFIVKELNGEIISVDIEHIRKLSQKADDIYSKYLQLSDDLPERITDLAIAITSREDSNYDKVKSIETHLSWKFPYTLKPRPTPKDNDFVDFFLFDLKEGYCTYYATAMTVLLRSIGIPARYVEGYMLPPEPIKDNTYEVTNENAHAWVEVYFEGLGWIPFEPTSPFMSSFYRTQRSGTISSEFVDDPYYMEYMQMLEMYDPSFLEGMPSIGNMENEREAINYEMLLLWTLIVVLFLIIVTSIINLCINKYNYIKLKNMPPKKSVLETTNYYFKLLSIQDYPIVPGETPLEYSKRINRYFIFEKFGHKDEEMDKFSNRIQNEEQLYKNSEFNKVIEIFLLARYSTAEITQNHKDSVLNFYDRLVAETKDSMGTFKYFIYRYILGKI